MIEENATQLDDALRNLSGQVATIRKWIKDYQYMKAILCEECVNADELFPKYETVRVDLLAAWDAVVAVDQATEPIPPEEGEEP